LIRVLIVDDQEIIRAGLATIITAHPALEVAGQAADGFAVLGLLPDLPVDVILLDLRMPGIDGVETIRRVRSSWPPEQIRILVLTTFEHDDYVLSALQAGADGFLGKSSGPEEITDGVIEVAAGGHALSDTAVEAVVGHASRERQAPAEREMVRRFEALTQREREVVEALVSGLDTHAIANVFVLSPLTVKTHANRAMAKVGARDRGQLVSFAVRAGIMPHAARYERP
jgi:DNA-binding NarL/FixJ family response regulator